MRSIAASVRAPNRIFILTRKSRPEEEYVGIVRFSIDEELIRTIKSALPVSAFVETGTFEAMTTAFVAEHFPIVYTIELSETLHAAASKKLEHFENVTAILGESHTELRRLVEVLGGQSVVYWLDAHWCNSDGTAGKSFECPVLEEIRAIGKLNEESIILIDDARMFLAPPMKPHNSSHWPKLDKLVQELQNTSDVHEVVVANDVIIFYPKKVSDSIYDYCKDHTVKR